jgi:uncharacterized membrane protein YbhN (UPF0104 family)
MTTFRYYGAVTAFWIAVIGVYAGVTTLASGSAWLVVAGVLAVLACVATVCFFVVLDAEDWWDEFRGQNRLAVICAVLLVVSLVVGVGLGWWGGA